MDLRLPLTHITLPELCLVVLVGAPGAGKSDFAARHFLPAETLSAEVFRKMLSSDGPTLQANQDALESLLVAATKRLQRGLLTVIDAPLISPASRQACIKLAREYDILPIAIALNLPPSTLQTRYAQQPHALSEQMLNQHIQQLRRSLGGLSKEGFEQVWTLNSEAEIAQVQVSRQPLPVNRSDLHGPFDCIGDVHGCLDELRELLSMLGYIGLGQANGTPRHPAGRQAAFVGDLTDRGPNSAGVLRLVMQMVQSGVALAVPGNHDDKLMRALQGRAVSEQHGLAQTLAQLDTQGEAFKREVCEFIASLPSHLQLDGHALVVAHAGLPERYQGRNSQRVRHFALYGDVDGSLDNAGLPTRRDWAADYHANARVVYGHTPVARPHWVSGTINIDTGCVFGGALSALRYPELELISVAAHKQYALPSRPFLELSP